MVDMLKTRKRTNFMGKQKNRAKKIYKKKQYGIKRLTRKRENIMNYVAFILARWIN